MRIILVILACAVSCQALSNTTTTTTKPTRKKLTTTKKPGDDRGKRNLFDIGSHPFGHRPIQRRVGYQGYFPSPYDHQTQFVQDHSNYLPDYQYQAPHYAEPPEPIIEIIIKESNDTLPPPPPQPIIQKKKKEHVQVFYVNYKKDKNNKLLLETPVSSLTPKSYGHHEEEEEIIHYPAVTPGPPLKTTTLRTVIHPDSEKYHSNSGIHVTFGTEDKNQYGHQLQEHNEESVVRSVVALPNPNINNYITETQRPHQSRGVETRFGGESQYRSDVGQSRTINNNFGGNLIKPPPQQHPPAQTYVSHHLEVPNPNPSQPFRQVHSHQYQITHHQNNKQHYERPQYQQQQPAPQSQPLPQPQALHQHHQPPPQHLPQLSQHQQLPQAHPAPQFQPPPHHQRAQSNFGQHQSGPTHAPQKQSFRFPVQNHHTSIKQNFQTQQTKYRPQPTPHKPIPIPIQNFQSDLPQQPFNKPLQFGPPAQPPPPQPQQAFNFDNKFNKPQDIYRHQPNQPPTSFENHQEIYNQNKFFQHNHGQIQGGLIQEPAPNLSPTQNQFNGHHHVQEENHQQIVDGIAPGSELVKSVPRFEQHITETVALSQLNQPFGRETNYKGLVDNKLAFNEFSHSNHNNVIQNIPAPHLGPSTPEPHSRPSSTAHFAQHSQPAQFASSTQNPNFGHYVTQGPQFLSSSPAPQQYFPSSTQNHFLPTSNEHLQVVTPVPSTNGHYNENLQHQQHHQQQNFQQQQQQQNHQLQQHQQYQQEQQQPQHQQRQEQQQQQQQQQDQHQQEQHQQQLQHQQQQQFQQQFHQHQQQQQQYLEFNQNNQPQIIPNSEPHHYQIPQRLPPPGQSVSTIHTEALRELEQRKNFAQNPQNSHNYVQISARNKATTQQNYNYQQSIQPTSSTTPAPSTTKQASKKPTAVLPDEVPEDLRQQLLSSGILDNADISVLDYDKLGDTAIENLPPEHLSHFYGAGGGAQISESKQVLTVVKPNGEKVEFSEKQIDRTKEKGTLPRRQNVDLKVVRFDSNNQKSVTDKYIKQDSPVLPPVDISSDRRYNRYLPLKVSGAQFPIPDASELRGKKIASVVVLAPVDTLQSVDDVNDGRQERDLVDSKEVKFIAGDTLKQLLKKPVSENFRRWLDKESKTEIDNQSVVLLVVKNPLEEQEIYMYDISSKSTSKLNGELSTAFVKVAEENAESDDLENAQISDSGIVERMAPPLIEDPMEANGDDVEAAGSSIYETVVKFSQPSELPKSEEDRFISVNSGYSVIKARN